MTQSKKFFQGKSELFGIALTADLGRCKAVWQSYGIAMAMLPWLGTIEALQPQALNKFWYQIAVSRVQRSFDYGGDKGIFMFLGNNGSFGTAAVFVLNAATESLICVEDHELDLPLSCILTV